MFFMETIFTEGIAQLSYLIGDDSEHIAAVVDPRADVEVYLALARKRQVAITHIFETHIHADFMSGSRELAARCPNAKLLLSGEGNSDYEFEHESVRDGQEFKMGSSVLRARFTPGHTPEHLSYELCDSKASGEPWGILTGDSLFVESAGRPDLLGSGQTEGLTQQLYETLYDYYLKFPDHVIIHPGHGAGSACGADIGERLVSTVGYERRHNSFLRQPDLEHFDKFVREGAPPAPEHYFRLKKLNARGAKVIGGLPVVIGLTPDEFHRSSREPSTQIVDTRHMLAFGGGHIPKAINIGSRPELSIWAGQMLDPDDRLLLIVEHDDQLEDVVRLFVRTGFVKFAGYLVGGMTAWANAGFPIVRLPQVHVRELKADSENGSHLQVLDVRSPEEFDKGHIPGAEHLFVADMRRRIDGLDKERPIATYCASGYRASLASSLMQSRGFKHVSNVPGSWEAWTQAGYPVETPSS
ncbi:MAG TPA: rhodanese-like domain-containing protein [Pirellulaceae bacterium]|nr:rhodanese-like domain-containing protein [Pirellulaceae bacterium]